MCLIEASGIQHHFFSPTGYSTVLHNVSFTVEKGEFLSFIGPSGCGKSTLLSIIAGLITPTVGTMTHDLGSSEIGYMLQQDYLFPWKTIEENILLGPTIMRNKKPHVAQDLLEAFQLSHTAKLYPHQLSGGMRQRIALARTLAMDPTLLLLDEPFSALDYQTKLLLESFVSQTLKQLHKTAILVTHDINEAIAMSDRIYLFSHRPGTLLKSFIVPAEIRKLPPLEARNHEAFPPFFKIIWEEFEALGTKTIT